MNQQQRELIQFLRSGEIQELPERSNILSRSSRAYSLNGAICEIYRRHHPTRAYWQPYGTSRKFRCDGASYYTVPPGSVARWMGLRNEHGAVERGTPPLISRDGWPVRNLTALYECGLSLAEIADLIEERAQDLFQDLFQNHPFPSRERHSLPAPNPNRRDTPA